MTSAHPRFAEQPGRIDLVRSHNLALVLQRVHLAAATRSELTRVSGLNRSTIGALVAELVERGLVDELEVEGDGRVGRPSPLVRPSDGPLAIAINPEIDAVTVATVQLGGRVLAVERVPFDAPPSPSAAIDAASAASARLIAAAGGGHRVIGAGVAVPGIVDATDGRIRLAPHLGWRDVRVTGALAEVLGVPVAAANDAQLGAQAEWVFGAGRGGGGLVYLNGGPSGIGGGVVAGGGVLQGAAGHAGEIGHMTVRPDGDLDTIGARGTLESVVTRQALLDALGIAHAAPAELEVAILAADTSPMRRLIEAQLDALAIAIGGVVTILNPARIILGGFLSAIEAADPDRLRRGVAERALPGLAEPVEIRRAALGADILLIAAAEPAFAPSFSGAALA